MDGDLVRGDVRRRIPWFWSGEGGERKDKEIFRIMEGKSREVMGKGSEKKNGKNLNNYKAE